MRDVEQLNSLAIINPGKTMNLHALYELRTNVPDAITRLAESKGLDPVVAEGVAILLLANDGNLASLSPKQKEHFDGAIKPLIE